MLMCRRVVAQNYVQSPIEHAQVRFVALNFNAYAVNVTFWFRFRFGIPENTNEYDSKPGLTTFATYISYICIQPLCSFRHHFYCTDIIMRMGTHTIIVCSLLENEVSSTACVEFRILYRKPRAKRHCKYILSILFDLCSDGRKSRASGSGKCIKHIRIVRLKHICTCMMYTLIYVTVRSLLSVF